jgi:hypothetical protein
VTWSSICTTRVMAYMNSAWVDITAYVLVQGQGQGLDGSIGRANELNQINASNLSLVLKNNDGRFTPDNPAGAYYPYWKSGVQIMWTETIGAKTFRFPDMWVEVPEVALTFEVQDAPEVTDRVLRVGCIDRKTRLDRAPRFPSVLAAHITSSSSALAGHWTFTEPAGSRRIACVRGNPVNALAPEKYGTTIPAALDNDVFSFATIEGPTGDDARYPLWDSAAGVATSPTRRVTWAKHSFVGATTTGATMIALSAWVYFPSSLGSIDATSIAFVAGTTILQIFQTAGVWGIFSTLPGGAGTPITDTSVKFGQWALVTAHVDTVDNVTSMWIDEMVFTAATTGAPSGAVDEVTVTGPQAGSIGHVQLYIGASGDFTRDDHLAQFRLGRDGLYGQTVDQRIRTICNYAGVSDANLDLEPSDPVMPHARFAGQRPGSLASTAAVTGGGILFTRESELVYQDRKHRFDL